MLPIEKLCARSMIFCLPPPTWRVVNDSFVGALVIIFITPDEAEGPKNTV